MYEELTLPDPPGQVLDTIRRVAGARKWRLHEHADAVLVTGCTSWFRGGWQPSTVVLMQPHESGTTAQFLSWTLGAGAKSEMRRRILELMAFQQPVYGPPGAAADLALPRDLSHPMGSAPRAPHWVRRTRLLAWVVTTLFFAAWVAAIFCLAWVAAPFHWFYVVLPLLLLSFVSGSVLPGFLYRRRLHFPMGIAPALTYVVSVVVVFAAAFLGLYFAR